MLPVTSAFSRTAMGISTEDHRIRTGVFGNVVASRPGLRKHVSLVNINFNLTSLIYTIYLQTRQDNTRLTNKTALTLLQIILLYASLTLLSLIMFGQLIVSSLCNPQSVVAYEYQASQGKTVFSGLLNWAVLILYFLISPKLKKNNIFGHIFRNYCKTKIKSSAYRYNLIPLLKNSLRFYTTIINLTLIVLVTPSIVNPGPSNRSSVQPDIKVAYCNAQGFILMSSIRGNQPIFQTNKLLDFQSFLHIEKPDIVVVNETWLNEHINNNEIVDEQYYKCYRSDRSTEDKLKYNKKGGSGVIILCRQDLDIKTKLIDIHSNLPIISIEIKFKDNTKICLNTFYRYGYSDLAAFLDAESYYRELSRKYKDIIIIGDLNLSSVRDWSNPVAENELENMYVDLFSDLGLVSLVNTRTHKAGNILDLILTNRQDLIKNVSIEPDVLCPSDHYTLTFKLHKARNRKKTVRKRVFVYSKGDWVSVNRDLGNTNWPQILSSNNMTENLNTFKSIVDITLRKYIPVVNIKSRGEPKWFDSEIREMSRVKDRLRKRARESQVPEDQEAFKNYRALYKQKVLHKKKEFITTVDPCESDSAVNKKFWSHVKSKTNCSRIPDAVQYNSRYRTAAKDKSELFNTFFCAQFSDASAYDIDINFTENSSYEMFITPSDVYEILRKVKPSKAPGPDGISGHVLKNCCTTLGLPLAMLFNLSYRTGQIPQEWKNANVVPIHKKKDKSNVENYRPISLTSLIMKIFEKCVRTKIFDICSDKITPRQHGFLPRKSCSTQMLEFTSDLAVNLNNKMQTDVIYFDFAKAFDSVNHDIILMKLKNQFGINGKLLYFILNYLKDRKQRVAIDGEFSEWQPVRSGVPQGSILGPLFFVLFINDIVEVISHDSSVLLYADDMKVWRKIKSADDQLILQTDISIRPKV